MCQGGKYEVTFEVEASKLYADGQGKETEAPLDEPFDIGVFSVEPGKNGFSAESVLRLERRNLKTGKQTITLIVDGEPKFVGADPYNARIDRNSEDNISAVEMGRGLFFNSTPRLRRRARVFFRFRTTRSIAMFGWPAKSRTHVR